MKFRLAAVILLSSPLFAQSNIPPTVHEDARVIRRIAQMSKRDFPGGLVARIVQEDMDLLRGKRSDGTYQFAHYAREEERRSTDRATIRDREKEDAPLEKASIKGEFVYRALVSVPGRRMVVAKNRRVFIDRVEATCEGLGLELVTPRNAASRGSQASFAHANGYEVMQALIERGVIGDFRAGDTAVEGARSDPSLAADLLRFGFTPLYTRFVDAWDGAGQLHDVLQSGAWREPRHARRSAVT